MRRNEWCYHQAIHDGGSEKGDAKLPTDQEATCPRKGRPEGFDGGKGRTRKTACKISED